MFEKYIENLLLDQLKLGEWLEGVDSDSISMAIWKGELTLKNVKIRRSYTEHGTVIVLALCQIFEITLRRDALKKVTSGALPCRVKYGFARSLKVHQAHTVKLASRDTTAHSWFSQVSVSWRSLMVKPVQVYARALFIAV